MQGSARPSFRRLPEPLGHFCQKSVLFGTLAGPSRIPKSHRVQAANIAQAVSDSRTVPSALLPTVCRTPIFVEIRSREHGSLSRIFVHAGPPALADDGGSFSRKEHDETGGCNADAVGLCSLGFQGFHPLPSDTLIAGKRHQPAAEVVTWTSITWSC